MSATKFYLLKFDDDYADEHDVPAIACFNETEYTKWLNTPSGAPLKNPEGRRKLKESYMCAYLGNSGEHFSENYLHLYWMKDFVDNGLVEVHEVDESFYETFKRVELDSINMCNVFEIDE